jgi:hypothetical protein
MDGIHALIKQGPDMWKPINTNFWLDGWKYKGGDPITIGLHYNGKGDGTGVEYVPKHTTFKTYESYMPFTPKLSDADRATIFDWCDQYLSAPARKKREAKEAESNKENERLGREFTAKIEAFA